jgi:hypothetical protein
VVCVCVCVRAESTSRGCVYSNPVVRFLITAVKVVRLQRLDRSDGSFITSYNIMQHEFPNYKHEVNCAYLNSSEKYSRVSLRRNELKLVKNILICSGY